MRIRCRIDAISGSDNTTVRIPHMDVLHLGHDGNCGLWRYCVSSSLPILLFLYLSCCCFLLYCFCYCLDSHGCIIRPKTPLGRIAVMAMICFAIIVVPSMTNKLIDLMAQQSIYSRLSYQYVYVLC